MPLSPIEDRIIKDLVRAVKEKMPEVVKIIIFGSRLRGPSHEDSDLDVAVVFSEDKINFHHWQSLWEIKWNVLTAIDAEEFPLSLMPVTNSELSKVQEPFFKELKATGVIVWERNLLKQN